MNKNTTKFGFTLIELMLVIALVGIMVMVVLIMSIDSKQNAQLNATTQEFATTIHLARNHALQGKIIDDENPCAFAINVISGGTQYEVQRSADCNDFVRVGSPYEAKHATISPVEKLDFQVPFGESASETSFTIEHTSDPNKRRTVTVSPSGNIEITGN